MSRTIPSLPASAIVAGDCLEVLRGYPDGCAALVFTSPPYNVGMPYQAGGMRDGELTLDEWLDWLDSVWRECVRVLRPGGRLVVNVLDGNGRSPYVPVGCRLTLRMEQLENSQLFGRVIWRKATESNEGGSANGSAWGSWRSPSNPCLRDVYELLVGVVKQDGPLTPSVPGSKPDISAREFMRASTSVWSIPAETRSKWHPCPFPVALAERAIRFWTYPGDLVVDPFGGSGTTGAAAKALGRRYLAIELNPEWASRARQRVEGAALQCALPWGNERAVG